VMVPSDRVRRHGCVTPFPDCLLAIIFAVRRKCLICSLVRLVSSLAVAKLARNKKISDSVINRRQRRLGRYIEGLPLERHNSTSVRLLSASPAKNLATREFQNFPFSGFRGPRFQAQLGGPRRLAQERVRIVKAAIQISLQTYQPECSDGVSTA